MCESRAVPSGKVYRQLFDAQVGPRSQSDSSPVLQFYKPGRGTAGSGSGGLGPEAPVLLRRHFETWRVASLCCGPLEVREQQGRV